jgi:hypothetical protein
MRARGPSGFAGSPCYAEAAEKRRERALLCSIIALPVNKSLQNRAYIG